MNRWEYNLTISFILFFLVFSNCSSEKIPLWNGQDFSGWKLVVKDDEVDVNEVWSLKNDVIYCKGVPNGSHHFS